MLAAKLPTLMESTFNNLSRPIAERFVAFAEAEIGGLGGRVPRYSIKRIEEALDYCCDNPSAFHNYKTISEARKNVKAD